MMPTTLERSAVSAMLATLGIDTTDMLELSIDRHKITVVHRRRDSEGRIVAAGDELATVTTTIGITNG